MSSENDMKTVTTITIPSGMPMSTVEEALKSAVEHEWAQKMDLLRRLDALKAENERLREAGDAMAAIIRPPAHGPGEWDGEYDAWHAAKGEQP